MNDLKSQLYRGYAIEALVYAEASPRYSGKAPNERRFHAAVRVTLLDTLDSRVEKIAPLFEFYGDARRAAQGLGQKLVDQALLAPRDAADGIAPVPHVEKIELPEVRA